MLAITANRVRVTKCGEPSGAPSPVPMSRYASASFAIPSLTNIVSLRLVDISPGGSGWPSSIHSVPQADSRIVICQAESASRQPIDFNDLPIADLDPSEGLARDVPAGDSGLRQRKVRSEFNRFLKQRHRLLMALLCELVKRCEAAQIVVVRAQILGWLFARQRDFCVFQFWRYGAYDASRDLVLKVENVF